MQHFPSLVSNSTKSVSDASKPNFQIKPHRLLNLTFFYADSLNMKLEFSRNQRQYKLKNLTTNPATGPPTFPSKFRISSKNKSHISFGYACYNYISPGGNP